MISNGALDRYKDAIAVFLALICCFVVGAVAARSLVAAFIALGAIGCLIVYLAGPHWMAFIALFAAFAAMPALVPPGKIIGYVTIYIHEVLIVLAIAFLCPLSRNRKYVFTVPVAFTLFIALGAVIGILGGNEWQWIIWEAKPLVMMAAGFALAVLLVDGGLVGRSVRLTGVILWFSAAVVIVGSTTGLAIRGRNESLVDVTGQVVGEVARLVTWAQIPALAVLVALLAGLIFDRVDTKALLSLGLPALIVTVLGFSRSALLALAIATAAALLVNFKRLSFYRTARLLLATITTVVLLAVAFQLMRILGVGGWVADQVGGFSERVLGGLAIGADRDLSWQYRTNEITKLWPAFREAPLLGKGLGFAYQPPHGPTGYWARIFGPYYSHNFYFWLLAKTGIIGLAGFISFALWPIVRGVRATAVQAKVSAIVAISLLGMSYVWPVPEQQPDSIVLGIALGAAWAFSKPNTPSTRTAAIRGTMKGLGKDTFTAAPG